MSDSCCSVWYYIVGVAAAAATLLLAQRSRAKARRERLRQLWDSRGKDVVTLHMFHRARTCPNPSPFPIKLETYLRMAGIEYQPDFEEQMSAKGKSPWITVNGVAVADSQLAVEYLADTLGKDVDSHLSQEDRVVSRALRIMIEEHLYWCLAMERWVYCEGRDAAQMFPPLFPSFFPQALVRYLCKTMGAGLVGKQARAAGIGRHSKEEVEKLGKQDLAAVSAFLGAKPFLMGEAPSLVDATLFGFTNMLLHLPADSASVFKPYLTAETPNLVAHYERMKKKFWPDFELAVYKEG